MGDDHVMQDVYKKIEREKNLINGAISMRQSTNNPTVLQSLDSKIRDGRKNIAYLEERMQELRVRSAGGHAGGQEGPPAPPPKDGGGGPAGRMSGYGGMDSNGYGPQGARNASVPTRPHFEQSQPMPRGRPNYTKLDLIKYDTPYLGPRIQLMLKQLEFKLRVEKQYKEGIEKMVRLYQLEGDKKSKADAESRRVESGQKIQLLKQALKRYEDLHVDMESNADAPDDDSLNMPNIRKPLTGQLYIKIIAVKDVDHAAVGRFARGPETFVIIKVEDDPKGKTKATRTDKWSEDYHSIDVDKANEVELIVYDKGGDHPLPIGMLWVRITDIAEEMRRKKIESEFNQSGWVSADKVDNDGRHNSTQYGSSGPQHLYGGPTSQAPGSAPPHGHAANPTTTPPMTIDAWFSLEPVGQIQLSLSFVKTMKDKKPFDLGRIGRQGAIRRRDDEQVHEAYGHKFVSQQFYNLMRCALCGEFLKYAGGMQCSDCKYTCHKKCYTKVVTKCISRSNAETDPEEEKINHRIPHRFDTFTNMGTNWCCHCGYILPLGKKSARKCSECGLTCHTQCAHLVPDFCGMSMVTANEILGEIKRASQNKPKVLPHNLAAKSLRKNQPRPSGPGQMSYAQTPGQDHIDQADQRRVSGQDLMPESYTQPPQGPYTSPSPTPSQASLDAAKAAHYASSSQMPSQQPRPGPGDRTSSSTYAADAAKNAVSGGLRQSGQTGPVPYNRASTDYAGRGQPQPYDQNYPQPNSSQPPPGPQVPSYDPSAYVQYTGGYPNQPIKQPLAQQGPPLAQIPQKQVYTPQPAATQQIPPPQQLGQLPDQQALQKKPPLQQQQPPPQSRTRIGLDHFNFLAVLGKGNFGKVMLAETKASRQLYAIKVLKKEFIIENDEVESTRSEKEVFLIANRERHPFLLNLHACFQTETRVYFVMEYISGGDLMLHIQRGQFGTKRAQFYAAEVCLALKYFHENGVIYRDLKLDNILLTLDGHIKIADYGLCKQEMWYGRTTSTFCGTPEFMAPEILLDKKYGRAVDWWAFGVLIYQMLLQQSPFRGEDEDEIYDAILADEPLYPIHMPRDSVSILQKLLTREPELRLGSGPTDAQEIMSHAFFKNVNWEDVYQKRIQPPFQPVIKDRADTSNFDQEFTSVTPVLTPVQSVLSQDMQEQFRGFSYSADFV